MSYDEDLEPCDFCKDYVAQLNFSRIRISEKRFSVRPRCGNAEWELVDSRYMSYDEYQTELYCFRCYAIAHGSSALQRTGVVTWEDQPVLFTEFLSTSQEAKLEAKLREQAEEMRLRELEYHAGGGQIFNEDGSVK